MDYPQDNEDQSDAQFPLERPARGWRDALGALSHSKPWRALSAAYRAQRQQERARAAQANHAAWVTIGDTMAAQGLAMEQALHDFMQGQRH